MYGDDKCGSNAFSYKGGMKKNLPFTILQFTTIEHWSLNIGRSLKIANCELIIAFGESS
jgi:hypothetical protein